MRVLAFDPGHMTGVAIFDRDGNWRAGLTVPTISLTPQFLRHLTGMAQPDLILIESPPQFSRDQETDNNRYIIEHFFKVADYQIQYINPGQWKGMVEKESISGQHQIDAATMGRWWLRTQKESTYVEKRPRSSGGL